MYVSAFDSLSSSVFMGCEDGHKAILIIVKEDYLRFSLLMVISKCHYLAKSRCLCAAYAVKCHISLRKLTLNFHSLSVYDKTCIQLFVVIASIDYEVIITGGTHKSVYAR